MTAKEERDARLAAQLRANLKRRKAPARDAVAPPSTAADIAAEGNCGAGGVGREP